jgi:hypothetical protein
MLKRKGNLASHIVPYHHGRLTDHEYAAYQVGIQAIQPELTELMQLANGLSSLDDDTLESVASSSTGEVLDVKGRPWKVLRSLMKVSQSEVVLAQRGSGEFAIIERFPETSAYAQVNGANEIILTGNDPRLLVQDYAQNEQQALQFLAADLKIKALERIAERYPDQNHQQVTKAIVARLTHEISPQRAQAQSNRPSVRENRGVRV